MREALVVAVVAAWPPTLAAVLSFLAARAADRRAARDQAALARQAHDALAATVARIESAVMAVDAGVRDVAERLARLEGAHAAARNG
jgi:hypothetical protein